MAWKNSQAFEERMQNQTDEVRIQEDTIKAEVCIKKNSYKYLNS